MTTWLNRKYGFYVEKCLFLFLTAVQARNIWWIGQQKIPHGFKDIIIIFIAWATCFFLGVYCIKCLFKTE